MIIQLKKFGQILTSRDDGREAYLALQPNLKDVNTKDNIIIDFDGVKVFTPSWGDEFLTPLFKKFDKNLSLKNTENPSVKVTLDILEETNKINFSRVK